MDTPHKSAEKYAEQKAKGATPTAIFQACRADGNKNWECQVLLMGLFEMSLSEARQISHAEYEKAKKRDAT